MAGKDNSPSKNRPVELVEMNLTHPQSALENVIQIVRKRTIKWARSASFQPAASTPQ